jgi:DNA primase
MKYNIEKLNAIDIAEVAKMLGIDIVGKKGIKCFKGHDSKSPSLHFYFTTNSFYCFGCGIGSNNISLVMEYCEVSFQDACEILENKFFGDSSYKLPVKTIQYKKNKINFTPDREVYQWIVDNSSLSSRATEYLKSRGFTIETIKKYKISDIENPKIFFKRLRDIWDDERLYKCGLLKIYDGKYSFCWWRYTIVFPYFDLENKVSYLQGRYIDHQNLRWVNLPNVKSSLYNLNILNDCKKSETIYICEGITDTLSLCQKGKKAVGIMGANNFKKEYVFLLKNYDIWVVPDNDNGGETFYHDVQKKFSEFMSVKRFPFDKKYNDVTDFIQGIKNG